MWPPVLTFLTISTVFLVSLLPVGPAQAREIVIDDFADGLDAHWQTKSFAGSTQYTQDQEDNQSCIKAVSRAAASGLYYEIEYEPSAYPILSWSWKVEQILPLGDARRKAGDDYAARLYVVFPSFFFWQTRALNYIWANKLPRGSAVPNPFTDKAIMVAVESGPGRTGQWVQEQRNIYEDYKRYFGEEPPEVGAIAIMTDTDNTGGEARACYGPIRISEVPLPETE